MNPLHFFNNSPMLETLYPGDAQNAVAQRAHEHRPRSFRDNIPVLMDSNQHKERWYCHIYSVGATLVFLFLLVVVISVATIGGKLGLQVPPLATHDLYVETYGSDTAGDGTQARPFATISRASHGADGVSGASPGATIRVGPGLYNLTRTIFTTASGTAAAPIIYLSTILWGARLNAHVFGESVWLNRGSYVHILGFELSGGYRTGVWSEGRYVTVAQCYIHDIGNSFQCGAEGAGLDHAAAIFAPMRNTASLLQARSGFNTVVQNVITRVGGGQCNGSPALADGIYSAGDGDTIANNVIFANAGNGIYVSCAAPRCSRPSMTVAFNLLANNSGSGFHLDSSSSLPPEGLCSDNILVYNAKHGLYSNKPFVVSSFMTSTNIVHANSLGCSNQPASYSCSSQIYLNPRLSSSHLAPLGEASQLPTQLLQFKPSCRSPCLGAGSAVGVALADSGFVDFNGSPRTLSSEVIGPFLGDTSC